MIEQSSDRQVFRLQYPAGQAARLQTPLGEFDVLDCSEGGLCCRVTGDWRPEVSRTLQGQITFNCGDTVEVAGFVRWVRGDRVALRFSRSISARPIMNEQRWLRDHARQASEN